MSDNALTDIDLEWFRSQGGLMHGVRLSKRLEDCTDGELTAAVMELSDKAWDTPPGKVHDWRNYIPEWVSEQWQTYSLRAKLAMILMAEEQARAEEWD